MDSPVAVYKDEEARMAEIKKEKEEELETVKKVSYPFWTIATIVNCLLLIGYYYQDKKIK